MAYKKKFHDEREIPHDLKKVKLNLKQANEWQNFYVEGADKGVASPKYYAWLVFRAKYRRRKGGWIPAAGQWVRDDRLAFCDSLWGVWQACKMRHTLDEQNWLLYFCNQIGIIVGGIQGIMVKADEDIEDGDTEQEAIEEPVEETVPLGKEKKTPVMDEDEDDDEDDEDTTGGRMPPAEEDDGSNDKDVVPDAGEDEDDDEDVPIVKKIKKKKKMKKKKKKRV